MGQSLVVNWFTHDEYAFTQVYIFEVFTMNFPLTTEQV